jgi:DNA-binding response OmpR family regulator
MPRILVVDDQRNMRTTLAMMLRGAGHEVAEAADGDAAIDAVAREVFDLVITDLKMGARDGIDVLRHVKEVAPLTEVIVMTAYGTIESAVEAMRIGAYDYIQKPFTEDELLVKVQKACEKRNLTGQVTAMASEFRERFRFENIIGRSAAIRDVLGRIVRIAPTDATVLITGESGTGKELVARAIHAAASRRRCSRANSSGTRAAPSRARSPRARGSSRRRTAAPSFSTRSPRRPCRSRPSSSAPSRRGRSGASARTSPSTSTCASSPPPTRTSRRRSPRSGSARTSTTA